MAIEFSDASFIASLYMAVVVFLLFDVHVPLLFCHICLCVLNEQRNKILINWELIYDLSCKK